ncbi:PREDICTED: uncharacterized protein LOC104804699 [Tarenaya hassleriana]|uniref:uncharacterized protein LOC104804699 n=1 Tax=Tarenaya hassleriana TaxID=28532 RepID=UPI00053CA1B1|nr:PREDICTED: uncharacterized protein LOC104804699 [Tarenaya hassleriana]
MGLISLLLLEDMMHNDIGIGRYYLGDSGYALRPGFLTPYRGERYHPDQHSTSRQPTSYKEMFNKKHSSLRLVIGQTFGIWKAK